MTFAISLLNARRAAGLTQAELARRTGVARPNVAAYEADRRQPLFRSAVDLLEATGALVTVEQQVQWSWADGLRPFAVPSRLWRLPIHDALRVFQPGLALWWSGSDRSFDLSRTADRLRAYEIVLREGRGSDIQGVVDGLLLCVAWPDLVLPRRIREAWAPLIETASDSAATVCAS